MDVFVMLWVGWGMMLWVGKGGGVSAAVKRLGGRRWVRGDCSGHLCEASVGRPKMHG